MTDVEVPDYMEPGFNCLKSSVCNHDAELCSNKYGYFPTDPKYAFNLTACQEDCGEGEEICMLCQYESI